MKYLMSMSFKALLQEHPFEKITIQMITDRSGLIRSTFYHHFKDKYDLLEWIIQEELIQPTDELLRQGQTIPAIEAMLKSIVKEQAFYHKAVRITGKNGFHEILRSHISDLFAKELIRRNWKPHPALPLLDLDLMSDYYAGNFLYGVIQLIQKYPEYSSENILQAYLYLANHSLSDVFDATLG